MEFVIKDGMTEFAFAGTRGMTRKIAQTPSIALTSTTVSTRCVAVDKVSTSETIRKTLAILANTAGIFYTLPFWTFWYISFINPFSANQFHYC